MLSCHPVISELQLDAGIEATGLLGSSLDQI